MMALLALHDLRDTGLFTLLTIITNKTLHQRHMAAAMLQTTLPCCTNSASAVPALLVCLHDPDAFIASAAAGGLGRLKADPTIVVPELLATLQHKDADVRMVAVWALDSYGDRTTMPSLSNCVHDPSPAVRDAATTALKRFRGEAPRSE